MGVEDPPLPHCCWPCVGHSTPLSLNFLVYETRLQIEHNPGYLFCFVFVF